MNNYFCKYSKNGKFPFLVKDFKNFAEGAKFTKSLENKNQYKYIEFYFEDDDEYYYSSTHFLKIIRNGEIEDILISSEISNFFFRSKED